jgi:outer membrane protein assembly factor BamE (lipoprotein component of BamABCDE complex)
MIKDCSDVRELLQYPAQRNPFSTEVVDYTFRKKNQALTMDTKNSVKIRDEEV